MRLHYAPGSAAPAPHATLAEIGFPYDLALVERDANGRPSDEHFALNPWGKLWLSNTVQMTQLRHFYPERYGTAGVKDAADAELAGPTT